MHCVITFCLLYNPFNSFTFCTYILKHAYKTPHNRARYDSGGSILVLFETHELCHSHIQTYSDIPPLLLAIDESI